MTYLLMASMLQGPGPSEPANNAAVQALREALREPFRVLVSNAGAEPAPLLEGLRLPSDPWTGYDALTGAYRDLREAPVLADPWAVVLTALETAVSVARTILTAEVAITRRR
jgi:chaperonin GroEL (HSP60 family)